MRPSRQHLLRDEQGSVLVETAAAYMLGMTLVLGLIECCMMCFTFGVLSEAARNGVHYASIHGSNSSSCSGPSQGCGDSSAANVVGQVTTFSSQFINVSAGLTVSVTYPDAGGSAAPSRVMVGITYIYQPIFHIAGFTRTFHVVEQGRIIY